MSLFPKKERLTTSAFDRSFSLGKRVHSPTLQLIYHPSDTFHGSVVVGKKVFKSAVTRNRARRQLYAVLYQFQKTHNLPQVVIVIAKPTFKNLTSAQRRETLTQLLTQTFLP